MREAHNISKSFRANKPPSRRTRPGPATAGRGQQDTRSHQISRAAMKVQAARTSHRMQPNRTGSQPGTASVSGGGSMTTAQQLEALCRAFLDCLDRRQFDERLALYFSSDFVGVHQNATTASFAESILNARSFMQRYPNFRARLIAITASVDEESEQASVFLSAQTSGYPDAFVRETMSVFKWRKQAGRWMCYHHEWISGMAWSNNGR